MSKRTLYAIFIGKFLFSITLIAWTIFMTLGAGVGKDNDNTFMEYYHDVDANFNKIMASNDRFSTKYDVAIKINDYVLNDLAYSDIYLSQRVINDRKEKKNILSTRSNSVSIIVKEKSTQKIVDNINAKILFTMPSTHQFNKELDLPKSNEIKTVSLDKKSYWNIMGSIQIGDHIGKFYLKTNAI